MSQLINGGRPFLVRDATSLGLTKWRVEAFRAEGRLRTMFRGVVIDARSPDTKELRALALDLVRPMGATFYGETVAWLHGLDVFRPRDRHELVPRCIVPHGGGRPRRGGVVCHEGYLSPRDVEVVAGLRVTTAVRTVCDLLRTAYRPHALAAADAFAVAGLIDPAAVQAELVLLRGFPGIRQARVLAELIDPGAKSAGESWTRLRLIDAGLPMPRCQIELCSRSGEVWALLDMGYPDALICIEYDGRRDHTSDEDREHDADRRRRVARDFGWHVVVVTNDDVWGDDRHFEEEVAELLGVGALARTW